jgi:hypothetical protein
MTNTRFNARTASSRESSGRKAQFEEPNWLDIPDTVRERFRNEGQALRWIRVSLKNQDDYQNVGKRQAEGWTFVGQEEVPEMLGSSFVRGEGRYSGAVCRGDLALAKMPLELAESRQEFYENRSREMVDAVNAQLMRDNVPGMPISNASRTQVSRGKSPKFQD